MRHCRSWFAAEAVAWMAVFLGSGAAAVAAPPAMPQASGNRIVLENKVCRHSGSVRAGLNETLGIGPDET